MDPTGFILKHNDKRAADFIHREQSNFGLAGNIRDIRFGSLADHFGHSSLMSDFGDRAVTRSPNLSQLFGHLPAWSMTKATRCMIIDKTGCLHVRVQDGAANKFEAAFFHVLAQRIGLVRRRGNT